MSGHDRATPGNGADLRVLIVPTLDRGVLLHGQTGQGDVVCIEGQSPSVLDHLDLVLAGIDADDIGGAPVRLDVVAVPVVLRGLQGDRVGVVDEEGGVGHLFATEHLSQGLTIDENLLGVSGDALLGRVGVDGADCAETDHIATRGPLSITPGAPVGRDLGTVEYRLGTFSSLNGHTLVHSELTLTVGAIGQLDGVTVSRRLEGRPNGLEGIVSSSVPRV